MHMKCLALFSLKNYIKYIRLWSAAILFDTLRDPLTRFRKHIFVISSLNFKHFFFNLQNNLFITIGLNTSLFT